MKEHQLEYFKDLFLERIDSVKTLFLNNAGDPNTLLDEILRAGGLHWSEVESLWEVSLDDHSILSGLEALS